MTIDSVLAFLSDRDYQLYFLVIPTALSSLGSFIALIYLYFMAPKFDKIFGPAVFSMIDLGPPPWLRRNFPNVSHRMARAIAYAACIIFPRITGGKKARYYYIFKGYDFRKTATRLDIVMSALFVSCGLSLLIIAFAFILIKEFLS